jgi:hypothetical protein
MRIALWLDRLVAFVSPWAGIRRARAQAALRDEGKPIEPPARRQGKRGFDRWWAERMKARGWDR